MPNGRPGENETGAASAFQQAVGEGDAVGEAPPPSSPVELDSSEPTVTWPIRRFRSSGKQEALQDVVVQEQRIELVLNGTSLLALLALPRDLEALALGFLASEGLWQDQQRVPEIHFDAATGQLQCTGEFDDEAVETIHRRWVLGTGCGGGGTARDPSRLAQCRPIDSRLTVRVAELTALGKEFNRQGRLFRTTGGVHACAIAAPNKIVLFAEDVGRHNALDKVAGMALSSGVDLSDSITLTTGRLSAEIVAKGIAHGVPILASSSAPTGLGVEWARRFGITLVGFLRGGRLNVYTGYQRIVADDG